MQHKANISNKMSKKKRILLIVNSGLLNSGVPKIVSDIVTGLHSEFNFDILVQSSKEEYYDAFLKKMGCRVFYSRQVPTGRLSILYRLSIWVILLFHIIRINKYHCIHSFTAYQSGIDCWVASLLGVGIRISNTHGTVQQDKSLYFGSYQKFCKYLIRKYATHRIGVSKQAAESIYDKGMFSVIYNSVSLCELYAVRKKDHSGLNFLQVGYFNDNKNQLFSLSLLKELVNRQTDCHLYFIGFDNGFGYSERMNEYIKSNQLTSFVTILPHDYSKENIYPIIDFMLQPSYKEGLSLVALECQAAGIKCLVSNSIPDDVDIGLLHKLPLNDIKMWIDSIERLKSTNEKVDVNRASVFSRYNFLNNFTSIYNNIIK